MSGIYSTRFVLLQATAGTVIAYTVPAGQVAVIRQVDFTNGYGGDNGVEASVYQPDTGIDASFILETIPEASDLHWTGRQVLLEGECIVTTTNEAADVLISGYLLTP